MKKKTNSGGVKKIALKTAKILVTGGAGFLGRHVVEQLIAKGALRENISIPRSVDCDLRIRKNCERAVAGHDLVIHLAAKVGGIGFNKAKPGELFYDNLLMGVELMEAARKAEVKKFVAISTICAYPKFTPVPFSEKNLWNGYPEETNAPYGLAKKMLLVQAQAYRAQYGFNAIVLFPVNLYGPHDNFNPDSSHVIPALILKIANAKKNSSREITVWGTGKATREFLYVDDAAEGTVRAATLYNGPEPVNLGSGTEISIKQLVTLLAKRMDYKGRIVYDRSAPDGQPRRRLNVTRAKSEFGFAAKTKLEAGLKKTVAWYLKQETRSEEK